MNPIKENSYNRTKENIREIRHVYLDLDEGATASLQAIRTSGDIPTPNFVLDTSPEKHQVIWRLEGLDQHEAESLLRSLATQFRGDIAATDISRVLRLPGFANRKYNEKFLSALKIQETDRFTTFATSRCMRIRPMRPGISRAATDRHEECSLDTGANPKRIEFRKPRCAWRCRRGGNPVNCRLSRRG